MDKFTVIRLGKNLKQKLQDGVISNKQSNYEDRMVDASSFSISLFMSASISVSVVFMFAISSAIADMNVLASLMFSV